MIKIMSLLLALLTLTCGWGRTLNAEEDWERALNKMRRFKGIKKTILWIYEQYGSITETAMKVGFSREESKTFELYIIDPQSVVSLDLAGVVQNYLNNREEVPYFMIPVAADGSIPQGAKNGFFKVAQPTYEGVYKDIERKIKYRVGDKYL